MEIRTNSDFQISVFADPDSIHPNLPYLRINPPTFNHAYGTWLTPDEADDIATALSYYAMEARKSGNQN